MRIVLAIVAAILLIAGGFYAMRMMAPPPDDIDLAREKLTANGLYRVAIAPESEPIRQGQLHGWTVSVSSADGEPVPDADVAVDGGMPQHGHGLPTSPQVTGQDGEGRYRLEGMRFNMGGWWVLKVTVTAPAGEDAAEFNIML